MNQEIVIILDNDYKNKNEVIEANEMEDYIENMFYTRDLEIPKTINIFNLNIKIYLPYIDNKTNREYYKYYYF